MNLILLLILSLSRYVYYVNMSINHNGDGSYADNDVLRIDAFVYTEEEGREDEVMIVSIYITFSSSPPKQTISLSRRRKKVNFIDSIVVVAAAPIGTRGWKRVASRHIDCCARAHAGNCALARHRKHDDYGQTSESSLSQQEDHRLNLFDQIQR